jgi:hypothetical protein
MMMMVRRWLHLPRFLACFFISAEANEREEMKLAVVRIFKISAPRSYHDSVSFQIEETQVLLISVFTAKWQQWWIYNARNLLL